jgi:cysteinyl-tRNA synthetase
MEQAEESLRRIVDFLVRLEGVTDEGGSVTAGLQTGRSIEVEAAVTKARESFKAALESDLNTAAGLAAIFDLVKSGNAAIDAGKMSADDAALVRAAIDDLDRVLGVVSLRRAEDAKPPIPVAEIERMIGERKAAKQRRDFAEADRIRKDLADRGVLLEDGPSGTRWKKK